MFASKCQKVSKFQAMYSIYIKPYTAYDSPHDSGINIYPKHLRDLACTGVGDEVCLFTNEWLVVFFYVDDIVSFYHPESEDKFQEFPHVLKNQYNIRDIGELSGFSEFELFETNLNESFGPARTPISKS